MSSYKTKPPFIWLRMFLFLLDLNKLKQIKEQIGFRPVHQSTSTDLNSICAQNWSQLLKKPSDK